MVMPAHPDPATRSPAGKPRPLLSKEYIGFLAVWWAISVMACFEFELSQDALLTLMDIPLVMLRQLLAVASLAGLWSMLGPLHRVKTRRQPS